MADTKAKYILEAEDRTALALKKAKANFKGLSKSITKLGGPLAAIGTVAGLSNLVSDTAEFADEIGKTADKVGLTTDSLQELRFAAERSGMSIEQLDSNMTAFVKRVGEARQETGPLVAFLKKYDETLLRAIKNSKNQDEALRLIAEAIKNAATATDQAALANAAFSRSGIGMVNMLRDGADGLDLLGQNARDAGVVLEESLIRNAERINDRWDTLINTISVKLKSAVLSAGAFFDDTSPLSNQEKAIARTNNQIKDLNENIAFYEERIRSLEAMDNEALTPAIDAMKKSLQGARDEVAKLQGYIDKINGTQTPPSTSSDDSAEKAAKRIEDRFKSAIESMNRALAAIGQTSEYERILWEVQNGRYKDLNENQQQALLTAAREIDQKRAAIEAEKQAQQAAEAVQAQREAEARSLDEAAQRWRELVNPMETVENQLNELDQLLASGRIGWETYSEAVFHVLEDLDSLPAKTRELGNEMDQFGVQAARNLQDAFADFLFDPFDQGLKGMLRGFVDTLRRMAAELLAQQALRALFGAFGVSAGGVTAAVSHAGGVVGGGGARRQVPALAFAGAPRLHSGGLLGLRSDEVPTILQRGEEVLSRRDPRNANNGGGESATKVVLVDDNRRVGDYLSSNAGEKVQLEFVRRNARTISRILQGG